MTTSLRSTLRADLPMAPRAVFGGAFPDILSVQPVIWPGLTKQGPGLTEVGMTPTVFTAWPFAPGGFRLRPRHPAGKRQRMLQQIPDRTPPS